MITSPPTSRPGNRGHSSRRVRGGDVEVVLVADHSAVPVARPVTLRRPFAALLPSGQPRNGEERTDDLCAGRLSIGVPQGGLKRLSVVRLT